MIRALALTIALGAAIDARAQQAGSPPAVPQEAAQAPVHKEGEFWVPDMPDHWLSWSKYDGRLFSMQLSFAPIVDFTVFGQNDESIAQVGEQANEAELRSGRVVFLGRMKFARPVFYFVSVEYKGLDRDPDEDPFGFTDWYVRFPAGPLGEISAGKTKEPFVYEMVGDSANLPQMERILSPFFVSRNIGVKLSNTAFDQRLRWEGGWFNDWWVAGDPWDESGNDFAGRLTFLPQWEENGARYVHVGVAGRYIGPERGALRFKGRPESNVADNFVDTGSFTADHANALGLEGIWNRGPFTLSSEYTRAWVDSAETGNPQFWGFYIVGSYVLTGEHRPYDRNVGYARRVMPQGKMGAWELVGRYSHVDLDDRGTTGGILDKWYAGVNWWATRHWKFGLGYGLAQLDRFATNGTTHILLTRIQWIY